MARMKRKVNLRALCEGLAQDMGYQLLDCGFEKESAGTYLRIYLDSHQGISLSDCEAFHRKVQPLVEELDYDYLEVCSPGIDRPIKTAADAHRALNSRVEIRLYKPLDGQKLFIGQFKGLDEAGYHLAVGDHQYCFPANTVALAKRSIDVDQVLAQQAQSAQEESHE